MKTDSIVRGAISGALLFAMLPVVSIALPGQSVLAKIPAGAAKTKAIPRTPDGKPDLSGVWLGEHIQNMARDLPGGLPFTPAGEQAYKNNLNTIDPTGYCLFPGIPRTTNDGMPIEIVQNSSRVAMLYEYMTIWRSIPVDGRTHPQNPDPTFMGNSVGKWEGDTLVIDTTGFKENSWLDSFAHPHTGALHVIERWQRIDAEHINYAVTVDDPALYTKQWTHSKILTLMKPGEEPMEYSCDENNKDREEGHMRPGGR